MAAGDFTLYGGAIEAIAKGLIDLDSDTFKAKLLTSSYTPDTSTHVDISDLTNEVAGGGDYAEATLTGVSVTRDGTTVTFTSDPIDYGAEVSITAKYLAIYSDTSSSDLLLGYVDLNAGGGSATSSDGPFELSPHADGWFTIAPAA